jgi:predicted CopG family antitoxin
MPVFIATMKEKEVEKKVWKERQEETMRKRIQQKGI